MITSLAKNITLRWSIPEVQTGSCEDIGVAYSTHADESCRAVLNNQSDGTDPQVDEVAWDNNKISVRGRCKID